MQDKVQTWLSSTSVFRVTEFNMTVTEVVFLWGHVIDVKQYSLSV